MDLVVIGECGERWMGRWVVGWLGGEDQFALFEHSIIIRDWVGMSVAQSSPQGGVLCHSDRSLNDLHLLFQLRNPTLEKF